MGGDLSDRHGGGHERRPPRSGRTGLAAAIREMDGIGRRKPTSAPTIWIVDQADLDRATSLELELLGTAVRSDRAALERLLHQDFFEFGASGRRWRRDEVVDDLVASPNLDALTVTQVGARGVSDDVILVTYRTEDPQRVVWRSSLWLRAGDDWQILFHQGTLTNAS
jgi:hypothetical protein